MVHKKIRKKFQGAYARYLFGAKEETSRAKKFGANFDNWLYSPL